MARPTCTLLRVQLIRRSSLPISQTFFIARWTGGVRDVTRSAMAEEYRYTIGCTAGDWNQDGFPDLITANIGANRLLINNGDGTFTARLSGGER